MALQGVPMSIEGIAMWLLEVLLHHQPGFPSILFSQFAMRETSDDGPPLPSSTIGLKSSISWMFLSFRTLSNLSASARAALSSSDMEMRVEMMVPDLAFRNIRAFFAMMLVGVLWLCQSIIEELSFEIFTYRCRNVFGHRWFCSFVFFGRMAG